MAISYVGAGTVSNVATATASVAPPASLANNDILLLFTVCDTPTGTCTTPTGWTLADGPRVDTSNNTSYIFWKRTTGSESNASVTWSVASRKRSFISAFRGCLSSGSPIDAANGKGNANSGASTITAATVSASAASDFYVLSVGWTGGTLTTCTFDAALTAGVNSAANGVGAAQAYRQLSASGTTTAYSTTTGGASHFGTTAHTIALLVDAPTTFTLSGSGTTAAPTGSGTGLSYQSLGTLSGSGTTGAPTGGGTGLTYRSLGTLSGSGATAAPTGAGTGLTNTAPVYTLSGSGATAAPTGGGTGLTFTVPVYTLSGSGTTTATSGSGAGLAFTAPRYTLSGSGTSGAASGSGVGFVYTAPVPPPPTFGPPVRPGGSGGATGLRAGGGSEPEARPGQAGGMRAIAGGRR